MATAVSFASKYAESSGAVPRMRFGHKQIFLPNFTITLLRTPFLPPDFATFIVPLDLNKLDLKDYLYHAYNVRVLSVRSYVQQQRVREDKPSAIIPRPRRWFRPRAIKKMTVQMEQGFVWPEEPTDFKAWDKETYDTVKEAQELDKKSMRPESINEPTPERTSIAEQARRMLRGEETWKPTWEDVGPPVEVEKEVQMEK
ncbi:MAG: hypothetical protein M1823_003389 [Watsoniomyces obsoletus]|nr:MAG: hypothetical protein M1823_003389 [Watsoniomyces obsoletus]